MRDRILEVRGLEVRFGVGEDAVHAVRGVDLTCYRGEVLALVGESGSGKSLTGKAIMDVLPSGAELVGGEIIYKGKGLETSTSDNRASRHNLGISMVPQDPFTSLDPIMRVGEQVGEAISGDISGAERRERVIKLLTEVGITDPEKRYYEYPHRFSGGMRQRIVIAAAIADSPELLICDEPTTALDVTIEAQILDLFLKLKRERGMSIVFITHDLGVVARIADRVAVIYAGKIVEEGSVEDIFYRPMHPYTWALLDAIPTGDKGRLNAIPGQVPDMRGGIYGDAFYKRNAYALRIDKYFHPPKFEVGEGHYVYSWLYHRHAVGVEMPRSLKERIERMRDGKNT